MYKQKKSDDTKCKTSFRLLCDMCLKPLCSYQPVNSEREFMNQLARVLCNKCTNRGYGN